MSRLFSSTTETSAAGITFGPGSHLTPYYISHIHAASGATAATVASTMYMIPISVPTLTTFASIGIEVTTTAASSSARLGIYEEDLVSGGPGALLSDLGTVDTASSTGEKTIAFTTPLVGSFWLVCVTSAHTPTLRSASANTINGSTVTGANSFTSIGVATLRITSASSYFSALPASLSGLGAVTSTRPIIFLKF